MTCPHCGKSINAALAKIGAKGGKVRSEKKAEAARLNGLKGGRKKDEERRNK
jgi:predicted Zn finger-like uncharacterized protein